MTEPAAPGIVYIFTNEAMPGFVKIGMTQANDVATRLRQLDVTAVPLPFECHYSARVPDCRKLERTLHFVFGEKRARLRREFFKVDPDLAKAIIELVATADVTPSDAEQGFTPEEKEAIVATRKRADNLTFDMIGLKPGTLLTFSKDPNVTCTIVSSRKVSYEGQEVYLSRAALLAVRKMGYNWPSVRGWDYWMHDGKRLSEIIAPVSDDEEKV
ncbi:GIY-YIG nuclease family protein [Mesorhizobium sp.]|uniref:GIY-YIG nuclease family protein n=1 Tax=Mesorhizobium sp. TaxID=1871066 RepID=UPI0025F8183A|nr:GIY-YIG nuclease family protein [Mesorhizobium sp.]